MIVKIVTIKIHDDLLLELEHYSELLGITRSELIRRAIARYLLEISSEAEALKTQPTPGSINPHGPEENTPNTPDAGWQNGLKMIRIRNIKIVI